MSKQDAKDVYSMLWIGVLAVLMLVILIWSAQ